MIDNSSFGQMVIDGTMYTSDLIIYPDGRVTDSWWRQSGHRLSSVDIDGLIKMLEEGSIDFGGALDGSDINRRAGDKSATVK